MDLLSRAVARHREGRADEAEALYRLALVRDPDEPNALFMLAAFDRARGDHRSAMARLVKAIGAAPYRPEFRDALGDVQRVLGDRQSALASYDAAVRIDPQRPAGWLRKADLLIATGAVEEALACLEQACLHCPDDAGLLDLNGVASMDAALYRRAEHAFAAALRWAPGRGDLLVKHALACLELGRLEQAIAGLRSALSGDAGGPAVENELALACFAAGRLDEGWAAYRARWQAKGDAPPAALASRPWDGRLRRDLRLLVCAEQGVGDQIMFAAGLAGLSATIGSQGCLVVECAPKLVPLFTRAWPMAVIQPTDATPVPGTAGLIRASYGWIDAHEPLDAITHLGDLARHMQGRIDGSAYLRPDAARAAQWRDWLGALGSGPKIGICWRSSLSSAHRDNRVPPLVAWRQLFEAFPQARFVNLQYHDPDGSSWAPACAGTETQVHQPPDLNQFDDLDGVAALMDGLDLVVSVPTAVAALSAALGRPTLRILRGCDWALFGRPRRAPRSTQETVMLSREWYGPSAMAPVIAAARARLGP